MLKGHLDLLLAERSRPLFRMRFADPLEEMYRGDLRSLLRLTRAALFAAIALAFAFAPLQEVALFRTPLAMRGSLMLFAQTIAPLALIAAVLTYLRVPGVATQGFQTAALLGTLAAVLALRHFALVSDMRYPVGMLGVVGIAVAVFGGFAWYPMVGTIVLFFGLGIVQEALLGTHANVALDVYTLSFAVIVAVLASFSNELLRRQNWLQREMATAMSRVDTLSGLSNRADFDRRIEVTLRQARRDARMVAVMVLDVDHFKAINDRHGHGVGDDALRAVAEAISNSCAQRPLDIKARTGGEEFIVVWYDVAIAAIPVLVERVLDAVRAIRLPVAGVPEPVSLTASAGACWGVPDEATTPEQLVEKADALMYQAKQAGRNRSCIERYRNVE